MNEWDWLSSTDPEKMLNYLGQPASQRKLSLFACSCWHRLAHLLPTPAAHCVVELTEKWAEGQACEEDWQQARGDLFAELLGVGTAPFGPRIFEVLALLCGEIGKGETHAHLASRASLAAAEWVGDWAVDTETRMQCDRLRDIFGNPFRPTILDPSWLAWNERCVEKLAWTIYAERRFEDLPILGDALEDAGCDQAELLRHCRETTDHVRGCHVLDLLTGKR